MGYPIQGEKAEAQDLTFTLDVPLPKDATLVVEVMGKSGLISSHAKTELGSG